MTGPTFTTALRNTHKDLATVEGGGEVGLAFGVLGVPTDLVGRVRGTLQRIVGRFPSDILK